VWNFITLAAFLAVYMYETLREKWLIDHLDCDSSKPDDVSRTIGALLNAHFWHLDLILFSWWLKSQTSAVFTQFIQALLHDDEFKTRYRRIADTIAFVSPPPGVLCAYIRKPLLFDSPAATSACNFLVSIIT
jgi:hypothetical protein